MRSRHLLAGLAAAPPLQAAAHTGTLDWHALPSDSLRVLLPLLLAMLLYVAGMARRALQQRVAPGHAARAASFSLGIVLLVVALVWPLDAWAELAFSAHMAQHMVLLALAPPLLVAGRPAAVWLRGLPAALRRPVARWRRWPGSATWRRFSGQVAATSLLHGGLLWIWHAPVLFELALRHEGIHWLEHLTLLGSGLLFWRALMRSTGTALGWGMAWTLVTVIHSGLLGALLTLAPRPLYGIYVERAGAAAALADQQLAGLIMWVPMGTVYLAGALLLAGRALRDGQRQGRPEARHAAG